MTVTVDKEGGVLHFQKHKEEAHGDSYLMLYEADLGARVFAHLYLRPATCSLVWRGTQKGGFDTTLPFEFFDIQFSKKPPFRVETMRRSVGMSGSSMLHVPYKFTKHRVTLCLADEERLREYDLIKETDKYQVEVVDSSKVRADIAFARFDAEVEYQGKSETLKGHRVSYSLTFERLGDLASDVWEFSIRIPRDLKLEFDEATLKWIARHHGMEEMLRMDFKASLYELSKILKPQTDKIYV
jgi:hypothetical protein